MEEPNSAKHLKTYRINTFVTKAKITEEEQNILDNIWNMKTSQNDNKQKLSILYSLVDVFTKQKRKFLYYGLFTGPDAGIYTTWEQMIAKIKFLEQNPRYGKPLYKGYHSFDEATKELQKDFGTDYVISEDIKSIQQISVGKHIKNETPESSTAADLRPHTPSFTTMVKKEPNKLKSLGTIPKQTFTNFTSPSPNHKPLSLPNFSEQLTRELFFIHHPTDLNPGEFNKARKFFASISGTKIDGMQINWETIRNINIPCTKQTGGCLENPPNCCCTIICAMPQININLAKYKYLVHENSIYDPTTLLNYGLIKKLYFDEWVQEELPEPIGNIAEHLTNILATDICMEFNSIPPHFGKNIFEPTKHVIQIKAKFSDLDYEDWDENFSPNKMNDTKVNEQSYERYRAYKIAQDQNWENSTLFLYAETPVLKIFITKYLEDIRMNYRSFDIYHPKPSMIKSYKKDKARRTKKDDNDDKDDVESTSMSTEE